LYLFLPPGIKHFLHLFNICTFGPMKILLFGSILIALVAISITTFFTKYNIIIVPSSSGNGRISISSDNDSIKRHGNTIGSFESSSAISSLKPGVIIICDSGKGFSRQAAIYLASRGFHVLAGVRDKHEVQVCDLGLFVLECQHYNLYFSIDAFN
jgi:hypothetical protein